MGAWLEQKEKVKELLASEEYKTLMKKTLNGVRDRLQPDKRQSGIQKLPSPRESKIRD